MVRDEAVSGAFRTEKEMTEAFAQLTEVFLADMGATWAGVLREPVLEEGRRLGEEAIRIARDQMPVHTSDLKVSGNEIQKLIERECPVHDRNMHEQEETHKNSKPQLTISTGDAMKYLLTRVQSGSVPNERDALLQAMERKLEKIKINEKNQTV